MFKVELLPFSLVIRLARVVPLIPSLLSSCKFSQQQHVYTKCYISNIIFCASARTQALRAIRDKLYGSPY